MENKPRPYWYVDLKWIFGILSSFFLAIFLLLFTIGKLTSEKTAIPLASVIVAGQFSKGGLDDATDIETTKRKFLSTNQNIFYPLENQNVSITRSELETLSPRELRLKIFSQIVEPYYYEKVDEKTKKQAGILGFINETTHKIIDQITLIAFIPLILCLIGLIFFSYKYGKLISPAVIFIMVSIVPTVFLLILKNAKPDEKGGAVPFLPQDITQELAGTLSTPYNVVFFAGIGLLLLAVALKFFKKLSR